MLAHKFIDFKEVRMFAEKVSYIYGARSVPPFLYITLYASSPTSLTQIRKLLVSKGGFMTVISDCGELCVTVHSPNTSFANTKLLNLH